MTERIAAIILQNPSILIFNTLKILFDQLIDIIALGLPSTMGFFLAPIKYQSLVGGVVLATVKIQFTIYISLVLTIISLLLRRRAEQAVREYMNDEDSIFEPMPIDIIGKYMKHLPSLLTPYIKSKNKDKAQKAAITLGKIPTNTALTTLIASLKYADIRMGSLILVGIISRYEDNTEEQEFPPEVISAIHPYIINVNIKFDDYKKKEYDDAVPLMELIEALSLFKEFIKAPNNKITDKWIFELNKKLKILSEAWFFSLEKLSGPLTWQCLQNIPADKKNKIPDAELLRIIYNVVDWLNKNEEKDNVANIADDKMPSIEVLRKAFIPAATAGYRTMMEETRKKDDIFIEPDECGALYDMCKKLRPLPDSLNNIIFNIFNNVMSKDRSGAREFFMHEKILLASVLGGKAISCSLFDDYFKRFWNPKQDALEYRSIKETLLAIVPPGHYKKYENDFLDWIKNDKPYLNDEMVQRLASFDSVPETSFYILIENSFNDNIDDACIIKILNNYGVRDFFTYAQKQMTAEELSTFKPRMLSKIADFGEKITSEEDKKYVKQEIDIKRGGEGEYDEKKIEDILTKYPFYRKWKSGKLSKKLFLENMEGFREDFITIEFLRPEEIDKIIKKELKK